jgi:hypothetical protein
MSQSRPNIRSSERPAGDAAPKLNHDLAVQFGDESSSAAIELAHLLAEEGIGLYIDKVRGGWAIGERYEHGDAELAFSPCLEQALEAALLRVRAQAP